MKEILNLIISNFDHNLFDLKLVLNADKTKFMLFSKSKSIPHNLLSVTTSQGLEIEFTSQYKYLGILIDDALSFGPHVQQPVKRCVLYAWGGWSALSIHRLKHQHVFIYKSILGLIPSYLHTYICKKKTCW